MKMTHILLTTSMIAALAAFQPALAHGGEAHSAGKAAAGADAKVVSKAAADAKLDSKAATAQKALFAVHDSVKVLGALVKGGKFDAIHEEIEKAEGSINAIEANATLEGTHRIRLEASLQQLAAQLAKLHTASDAKDAEKTKAEFKKVEGALKLVENALK